MYAIVKNAPPAPPCKGGNVKTPERLTMEAMDVGDAFMVDTLDQATSARWARSRMKPWRFTVGKVAGKGWQVRRVA